MGADTPTPSELTNSNRSDPDGRPEPVDPAAPTGPACDRPPTSVPIGVPAAGTDVPPDFTPVDGPLPDWIDIKQVCKEATRFVALHALSTFNAVAINDGRRVYTANDRGGEFRRLFGRLAGAIPRVDPNNAALVYDCDDRRQWVAPRPSAIRFLGTQF